MQIGQFETLNAQLRAASSRRPVPSGVHNPAWSEHRNPEDNSVYYFNSETNESVWDRPADFNPHVKAATGKFNTSHKLVDSGLDLWVRI